MRGPSKAGSASDIVKILSAGAGLLEGTGIYDCIVFHMFSQIFYHINSKVFNNLLDTPDFCTAGNGKIFFKKNYKKQKTNFKIYI